MPRHVSYWLVPAAPARVVLQDFIDTLSRAHNAPAFVPHVTIYSGHSSLEEDPVEIIRQATWGVEGVHLQMERIVSTEIFTKTLYVQLQPSAVLHRLSEEIRRLSAQPSGYVLDAHLSLLYKDMPEQDKQRLAASLQLPMAAMYCDEVWANASVGGTRTAEDVRRWEIVARQRLP